MKQRDKWISLFIAFCFIVGLTVTFPVLAADSLPVQTILPVQTAQSLQTAIPVQTDAGGTGATAKLQPSTTPAAVETVSTTSAIRLKQATPSTDVKSSRAVTDESKWYSRKNPMKKTHQELLWAYCQKRHLNYYDMLALISLESGFNEKCTTGKYLGYFQMSRGNCANWAATLKTKNNPLDGAININWGTAMFAEILADKRCKGLEGKKRLDVALSVFQRGTSGYDRSGLSTRFLKLFYGKRSIVYQWYGVK